MSKIGLGYGSEWHMLRMLGRHRSWFDRQVLSVVPGKRVEWLDFGFTGTTSERDNFGDVEIKGLSFLDSSHPARNAWQTWWPQSGNVHNWDAVGLVDHEEWVLVEAKANVGELISRCGARPRSEGGGLEQIEERLAGTKITLGVKPDAVWTAPYYQYANRLTLLHFLEQHGVRAQMLFIYFTGDLRAPDIVCPPSNDAWRTVLDKMKSHLGLSGTSMLEQRVKEIFIPVCPQNVTKPNSP